MLTEGKAQEHGSGFGPSGLSHRCPYGDSPLGATSGASAQTRPVASIRHLSGSLAPQPAGKRFEVHITEQALNKSSPVTERLEHASALGPHTGRGQTRFRKGKGEDRRDRTLCGGLVRAGQPASGREPGTRPEESTRTPAVLAEWFPPTTGPCPQRQPLW